MQKNETEEADWKRFRAKVEELRERFLADVNGELSGMLDRAREVSETEKFWDAEELIIEKKIILRKCFDDHRRSKLRLSARLMYNHGILSDEDLEDFSEDFRNAVTQRL